MAAVDWRFVGWYVLEGFFDSAVWTGERWVGRREDVGLEVLGAELALGFVRGIHEEGGRHRVWMRVGWFEQGAARFQRLVGAETASGPTVLATPTRSHLRSFIAQRWERRCGGDGMTSFVIFAPWSQKAARLRSNVEVQEAMTVFVWGPMLCTGAEDSVEGPTRHRICRTFLHPAARLVRGIWHKTSKP